MWVAFISTGENNDKRVAFISTPGSVLNSRSVHVRNEGSVSYEDRSFITRMLFQLNVARSRCANEGYPFITIFHDANEGYPHLTIFHDANEGYPSSLFYSPYGISST